MCPRWSVFGLVCYFLSFSVLLSPQKLASWLLDASNVLLVRVRFSQREPPIRRTPARTWRFSSLRWVDLHVNCGSCEEQATRTRSPASQPQLANHRFALSHMHRKEYYVFDSSQLLMGPRLPAHVVFVSSPSVCRLCPFRQIGVFDDFHPWRGRRSPSCVRLITAHTLNGRFRTSGSRPLQHACLSHRLLLSHLPGAVLLLTLCDFSPAVLSSASPLSWLLTSHTHS